jgi:excisionase family DNA binding protein
MQEMFFTVAPRWLRGLDEIAAYLKVSRRTVSRWIEKGYLPAMRLGTAYQTSTSLLDQWIIAAWTVEMRQRGVLGPERED